LLRVAKDRDATVVVDPVGLGASHSSRRRVVRASGRGAYLCPEEECLQRALRGGALGRALRYTGPLIGLERELRHRIAVVDAAAARVEPGR
jgi:predicted RNA-binding protein YlxR (DUF448 family)